MISFSHWQGDILRCPSVPAPRAAVRLPAPWRSSSRPGRLDGPGPAPCPTICETVIITACSP
jgi:hypothetical protein